MLIGIDASRTAAAQPTGTETYSRRLVAALLALQTPHRFRLYLRAAPQPDDLWGGAAAGRVESRVIPLARLWTHLRLSWELAQRPPDALFVPAHVLPAVHPPASVVTIHDLGYLHFSQAHPLPQRLYLDLSTRWSARAAAHLLADSAATKADLTARYGVRADKVTVAYPGVDEWLSRVSDPVRIEATKARYGIRGEYLLYLGTLQPRKNLARLIEAYASVVAVLTGPPALALAGPRGWLTDDLVHQVRRLGLEGRVLFPGYIREDDKAALLSGALAFVFPSLYEGFGLPVLEAQASGCPVISSATSSLPEAAGDAALLVDPGDTQAIASALRRVATDPALRRDLAERGRVNVRRFSWVACARTALDAIEDSVRRGRWPATS